MSHAESRSRRALALILCAAQLCPTLAAAAEAQPVMAPGAIPTLSAGQDLSQKLSGPAAAAEAALNEFWTKSDSGPKAPFAVDASGAAPKGDAANGAPAQAGPDAVAVPTPEAKPVNPPSLKEKVKAAISMAAEQSFAWSFRQLNRFVPWHKLPTPLAVANLAALRVDLRHANLHRTSHLDAAHGQSPAGMPERYKDNRSPDGRYTDRHDPDMGAAGAPFGRNLELEKAKAEALLGDPDPREVSLRLMTRKKFVPATIVNTLVAAWIQFMVHDWVNHGRHSDKTYQVPLKKGDKWPENPMQVEKLKEIPAGERRPGAPGTPIYRNNVTHWWDGSQIYGSSAEKLAELRAGQGGKLRVEANGLLPLDPNPRFGSGIDLTGFNDNYWVGLSMLHTLFTKEHNAIAEKLAAENPSWTDDQVFDKARLVNSALMAKIHTVEWTPAILQHPALQIGMKANWWGLLGKDFKDRFGRYIKSELLTGIPGSKTEHQGADYSLTEEFDVVYRMHTLIPDDYEFFSVSDGAPVGRYSFKDIQGAATRGVVERVGMENLFYSFGISHPGAIRLNNFPSALQNFEHVGGRRMDLATIDIIRSRERGIPRYNDFREMLRMPRIKSFEELCPGEPELAKELKDVYKGDINKVDTIVGMFAETPPEGFGFSDTAFRIFILMASRRLKSDRFLSEDYKPEVYTKTGYDWVENTTMKDVLLRHHPGLSGTLAGKENVFRGTWNKIGK